MAESTRDKWAEWLLHRRCAGDAEKHEAALTDYHRWRDSVLENARLAEGETLLDVGAGDGLIAFGALDLLGERGRVIFSDVSQDLLDHSRALAAEMGVLERCRFVRAPADDLSPIGDASVDAVTTRSVLIYVADKARAFGEFHRVLRPGGRVSVWEPINRFGLPNFPEDGGVFAGYDTAPVRDLASRVCAVFRRIQPPDADPLLDFDERDLLGFARGAGFGAVHLDLEARIAPYGASGDDHVGDWGSFARIPGNPKIPSVEEAIAEALTPEEAERFVAHLRPLVEEGRGTERVAVARLWAVKR
ncbi:MAG: class I SAM-dependent methyltransferase [Actinomycetota bacterium]|nr:class I SAM-dependent methyltransferase [Actinomycetota bacterium]